LHSLGVNLAPAKARSAIARASSHASWLRLSALAAVHPSTPKNWLSCLTTEHTVEGHVLLCQRLMTTSDTAAMPATPSLLASVNIARARHALLDLSATGVIATSST